MEKTKKNSLPTIKVSIEVKEKLLKYKTELGCKTFNEVINLLLKDLELLKHLKRKHKDT